MRVGLIVILVAAAVCPGFARAQGRAPRLELGTSGGAVAALGGDAAGLLVLGPRLTFNATPRDAVEVVAEIAGTGENSGLYGLYVIQYKRVLRPHSERRSAIFLTAGAGGDFQHDRVAEYRAGRPDGSVFVEPAYTHASLSRPFFGAFGVGFERVLARYAAFRGDIQVLAFDFGSAGLRGTLGVTIPIGGYRER
jgi:hypothetical protein